MSAATGRAFAHEELVALAGEILREWQTRSGVGTCCWCGSTIIRAIGPDGALLTLEPDDAHGTLAAWAVPGKDPEACEIRCRSMPGGQLRLGERACSSHPDECRPLAAVIPITVRRNRRRPQG